MIFDTIQNAPQYFALHPHLEAAFDWLSKNPNADEGRHEIIGDELLVIIENPTARGKSNPVLEAHQKYLDIQIVLEGEDEIGWKARADCANATQEYSAESDAILWSEMPNWYFKLTPGNFAILFPQDAHAPLSGTGSLKKAVFKVRVSL